MAEPTPPPEAPSPKAPLSAPERREKSRDRSKEGMLPARSRRLGIESVFMRVVATAGIVGIGVALAAILVSQKVDGWIVGLAVALTSVILSGVLWSTRQL